MNDRFLQLLLAIGVVVIGVVVLVAVLDKRSPTVGVKAPLPGTSAPTAPDKEAAADTAGKPAEPTQGATIYRCERGGKVEYSDVPCKGGRVVDLRVTEGYRTPPAAPSSSPSPSPGAAAPAQPAPARAPNLVPSCTVIHDAIASLDAAARAGGSAAQQDDLRERRRRLVARSQELGC
jgi:hypothetical protein